MTQIPILRRGKPYHSLDTLQVCHHRTGEPLARISQANTGLIARDLGRPGSGRRLDHLTTGDAIKACAAAADHFMHDDLGVGDTAQTPADYVREVSGTTGLPEVLCRRNMDKICTALRQMEAVLGGLTRGVDLAILDAGYGRQEGRLLSYCPLTDCLGAVLPSNSPGVHSLWLPAVALKMSLAIKPGREEPWTPYRIIQALIRGGCPPEAFGYYPSDHAGAAEILRRCGRSMLFGDASATDPWRSDRRVEIHGPGYSKVLLGQDAMAHWEDYIDVMVASILDNAGRSCINASVVWVPERGREVADALAERLAAVATKAAEDPEAQLAAFANSQLAERISRTIDDGLAVPAAEDVTASYRHGERVVHMDRCAYLLPTIVWCGDRAHPLANREFLFPYSSVVEVPQAEMPESIGHSMVVSAITEDEEFIGQLLRCANVDRLNLGPIPTSQVRWDQPHEGNLFEHLYRRRAFQLPSTH